MKRTITALAAAVVAAASLHAAELDSLLARTLHSDPSLAASAASLAADNAAARADNYMSSPEVEFEHLWGKGQTRWSAGISQEIDWPGLYGARRQGAESQQRLGELMLALNVCDRALSYKLSMIDVINARARLQFYAEVDSSLERIAELTRVAYDHGEATILDLRKTRLAVIDSRREVATARAELQSLIALLEASGTPMPAADSDIWAAYPAQALTPPPAEPSAYPQYALGNAEVTAARAAERVARMASMPSLAVGYRHAFEDGRHFNGLTVAVRLPSFARKRRVEAAALAATAASLDYNAALAAAMAETAGQYKSALELREVIDSYSGLTSDNTYLELLRSAFDGGELTVIDYITEINLFRQSRLNYLDALYRYNLALVRLNRYRSAGF